MNKFENQSVKYLESSLNVVEVPSNVDFVYIMRKDSDHVAGKLGQTVAVDYGLDKSAVTSVFRDSYEVFIKKLTDSLAKAFGSKGEIEVHLFEAEPLEQAMKQKAGIFPIISLDPLMEVGVDSFCVSRGFYQGGIEDFGQIFRPGSAPLVDQADELASKFGDCPVCVVEDDIFSGGSVISALTHLQNAGVKIAKLIPGFQIGKPSKLDAMGIKVDPVITYKTADDTDIFAKVDLGDPRDYLLGASGLVVALSDGSYGRVPYLLPFVSTSARASVPAENELTFAFEAWQLNKEFFELIENQLGKLILLKHMDPYFVAYMEKEEGISPEIPMTMLVSWILEKLKGKPSNKDELSMQLEKLDLPTNIVFIDVDGTLIPNDSTNGDIDLEALTEFQTVVKELERHGVAVGLNSDSPLPQLLDFCNKLGISEAPIVAENGNIVYYKGQKVVMQAVGDKEKFREDISAYAGKFGLIQVVDFVSPTFGGEPVDFKAGHWAFGANRETSVTVFSSSGFIKSLGDLFSTSLGVSVECCPEFNFFAVHPGEYKKNKGITLAKLVSLGYQVLMIGNSKSDWIEPESGVKCAFVGGSRINPEIASQASYVSDLPIISGVTDILKQAFL